MKHKKTYGLGIKRATSILLTLTMLAPHMTPMVSYGAEYIKNKPRYVDFTRPEALTLEDLNLELSTDPTTEEVTGTLAEATSEASAEESSDVPENSSEEERAEESSESQPEGSSESLPEESSESLPEETSESQPEETSESLPEESSESLPEETSESLPEETPESLPGETVKAETAATPSDASLREPEAYYEEPVIDEPEGTLVRFTDSYRIYQTGEGEYVTVIGGYSGLYLTEEGEVEAIDNSLVESESQMEAESQMDSEAQEDSEESGLRARTMRAKSSRIPSYQNMAGKTRVTMPEELSPSHGITMEHGAFEIEMSPAGGDFSKSAVAGNSIRYNDVYENVDYQYTVIGNSLKEDIILLERQERNQFSFRLNTPGLKASLEEGVILVYEGSRENPLFVLDAPFMEDAEGTRSSDVKLTLAGSGGAYTVKVEADREWLEAEERQYPVRIDPTPLVPSDEFIFATVSQGEPAAHYDWDAPAYVGYVDGSRGNTRIYVAVNALNNDQFNAAMAGATNCTSAVFEVTAQTDNSQGQTVIQMRRPIGPWDAGRITWNTIPAHSEKSEDVIFGNAPGAGGKLEFDITHMVKEWSVDGSTHFGFMMKAEVEPKNEEQASYRMPAEILYNRTDAQNGPRIKISWEGELPGGLEETGINDTTVDVHPSILATEGNGRTATGILAHGLARPGSTVHYVLMAGSSEKDGNSAEASSTMDYPDFEAASLEDDMGFYANSNWQSEGCVTEGTVTLDRIYQFRAYAEGKPLDEEGNADEEAES